MTVRPWLHAVWLQGVTCLLLLGPAVGWSAEPLHVVTDATWKYSPTEEPGWQTLDFDDAAWPVVEAPSAGLCPPGDIGTPIPDSTAQPIWRQDPEEFQTIYTRKTFTLEQAHTATIQTFVDDEFELYVNGQLIRRDFGGVWTDQVVLAPGPNVLAIKGIDSGGGCQAILADLAVQAPLFLVTTTADSGPGSLRQAILEANGSEEATRAIGFQIPTTDPGFDGQVFTIAPTTALPAVEHDTTLDGTTQTTFTGDTNTFGPEVVLHGGQVGDVSGITLGGDQNLVRGLIISGFAEGAGVLVVRTAGPAPSQNQVLDSYLGTDPTGTEAVANGEGIVILGIASPDAQAQGTVIQGNLIAGNTGAGLRLCEAAETQIIGNRIGTDRDGINPLGNSSHGISLECAGVPRTQIADNTIAFNGGDGVRDAPDDAEATLTSEGHQNTAIRRNAVFVNAGLGINLLPPNGDPADGVTPNDACDADEGANRLQNFPVLTLAGSDGEITIVMGTLDSMPNQSFEIDLFANAAADPSGFGEGQSFLGTMTVTTDASCQSTFTAGFFTGTIGQSLTATATDATGNTSEFAAALPVLTSVPSCQGGARHIRGRITASTDATGLPGIPVTLFRVDDACQQMTTTQALGVYTFPNLPDGTYIVLPNKEGCTFTPPSQTVGLFGGDARLNFVGSCP